MCLLLGTKFGFSANIKIDSQFVILIQKFIITSS